MRNLELAVKYLAGERLIGTAAERLALEQFADGLGSSANGTTYNTPTIVTSPTPPSGLGSNAIQFNGSNQYVLVPANANMLQGLSECCITFWINPDNFSSMTSPVGQFESALTDGSTIKAELDTDQKMNYRLRTTNNQGTVYNGGTSVNSAGSWSFCVMNFYATYKMKCYINGSADSAGEVTFANDMRANANSGKLSMGGGYSNGAFAEQCPCKLTDISIWSRKLTEAEITALWNGGDGALVSSLSDQSGLRTYWDCQSIESTTFTNDAITSYPNLSNGTLFEESDTGKIYMFDGTSAWNEM